MKLKNCIFILWVVLIFSEVSNAQNIYNYQKYFAICKSSASQQSNIAIRKFQDGNGLNFLVVNPHDLSTAILRENQLIITNFSWEEISDKFNTTAYMKAIQESLQNADVIQDAGITHFSSIEKGANLSIDLCPSVRPLDRELFINLIHYFVAEEKPVPVAISVTGIWMEKHQDDLNWLKDLVNKKEISIIWVNHTYTHRTSKTLPLKNNFLLEAGTDLNYEVLQTEVKMIEEGIIPSVFFRFPGLVSDKDIFNQIVGFGLIPIGSDAWLGKNQSPKDGSIILLHANGNEPIGIERFLKLLKNEQSDIKNKAWLLYDLRESVENFEDTLQIHK